MKNSFESFEENLKLNEGSKVKETLSQGARDEQRLLKTVAARQEKELDR